MLRRAEELGLQLPSTSQLISFRYFSKFDRNFSNFDSCFPLQDLHSMLRRAEDLGLQLPCLPRLHELMRTHRQWERRVREALQSGAHAARAGRAGPSCSCWTRWRWDPA